jgi:hypothetical protein
MLCLRALPRKQTIDQTRTAKLIVDKIKVISLPTRSIEPRRRIELTLIAERKKRYLNQTEKLSGTSYDFKPKAATINVFTAANARLNENRAS